jgi:hypothetical protein
MDIPARLEVPQETQMKPFLPSTKPNSVFWFELFLSAGDQGTTGG